VDRADVIVAPDAPLAFVDVETTGCAPGRDRIIDIAVIGARDGVVEFQWQSLVNPGVHVGAGITALTGIDNDMLADAPEFARVARELRARLEGRVFVAHNARFDYGFVRREFARLGTEWRAPSLCTVRLSRTLYPDMPRHNLDAVMERHGITIDHRHRAMPDAQALLEFWRRLRTDWSHEELRTALDACAPRITLPPQLSADLPDDLPEEPGVYRFYGLNEAGEDTLIYVGKANHLRDRVLDHFRSRVGAGKSRDLAARVRRVEWTETAGELGALLLEAREIREFHPAYNRQARGAGGRFTWLFAAGAAPPRLVQLDARVLGSGDAFGTWRSEADARHALESLAREHRWCLKLLGLEQADGSCFGFQVGRCDGVCVGRENTAVHLARVKLGLMPQRLKPWPHPGPVVVREGSGPRAHYHVIDGWQHLATFDADEDAEHWTARDWRAKALAAEFNVDDYRILTRHLGAAHLMPLPAQDAEAS
jgi:DNA polymerase-3 subunit epsilon